MPVDERPPIDVAAAVGAPVAIELEALPGAALVWAVADAALPTGCTLTRRDNVPAGAGIGGPVRQRFELVCDAPGTHQLRFELKRPWEDVVRAVQEVRVDVR
jgi:hypothetical protein